MTLTATEATHLQRALGIVPDGAAGRDTYRALLAYMGCPASRAGELALAAAVYLPACAIDTPLRLAHFMGQLAHESGGFQYMEEVWGPTVAQKRYEGRAVLGNDQRGDGIRYKGRGPIQLTGRANYRAFGCALGMDFEQHPELVAIPSIGMRVACHFWQARGLNALADADDLDGITRKINGGLNGIDDRRARVARAKAVLL